MEPEIGNLIQISPGKLSLSETTDPAKSGVTRDMAAIGKYRQRIVGAIAVLFLFLTIGVAVLVQWDPLKGGPRASTRHLANPETSALAAYEAGNWQRAVELSRQSLKAKGDDPRLLHVLRAGVGPDGTRCNCKSGV